ncbi:MAG: hypothetical protein HOO94_03150 [Novosphingobium sp.]|nr:hypothetical protein [Novosphingobium sp.]
MTERLSQAELEAVDWVIRSNSADFVAWADLSDWMALSAANADAFNRLALLDSEAAQRLRSRQVQPLFAAANDDAPAVGSGRWNALRNWPALGGVAAALMVAVLLWPRGPVVIETGPGELREVAIADGVTASLNGSTRIEYSRDDPRVLRLVRGEALFDVRHGSGKPLEVTAGTLVMRDLGTTFDVVLSPTQTQLAVSQGKVLFDTRGASLPVEQGQGVRLIAGKPGPVRFAVSGEAVAGWRSGRLIYRDAGIVQIAEDLSRRFGAPVTAAPAARSLRFTGAIGAGGSADETIRKAGIMLGASPVKTASGWRLDAPR